MRAETRPDGKWAVERVQDSGTAEARRGSAYQVWNWVKGSEERSRRERVPTWNWAAREGWWASDWWKGDSPGATGSGFVLGLVFLGGIYEGGVCDLSDIKTYAACNIKYQCRDLHISFLDFELAPLSSWLVADAPEAECRDMTAVRRGMLFEMARNKSLLVLIEMETLVVSQYEAASTC